MFDYERVSSIKMGIYGLYAGNILGCPKRVPKKFFLNEAYIKGNHGFNAVMGIYGS